MTTTRRDPEGENETGRIEAFSDGVFAIAITLLVLDLKVPPPETFVSTARLEAVLLNQWPAYLAFLTSFIAILIMWVNHHALFKLVARSDTPFMFANGFVLLVTTIVPFPTSLVADYLTTPAAGLAVAVYAGVFVVSGISYNLLWFWASYHHHLLKSTVSPAQVRVFSRIYPIGIPLYLAAAILAFWNAYVSVGICLGLWVVWGWTGSVRKGARIA
ncbi:TMEM175 family protein [Nitrolancea hollandica]|uniref:DUF1211 domain-containing protein n=1 Tax=Nitrolancea hollandica Lb TaxID=1129897 RepID=I4EIE0_9BACT|nr:TMEM175 family protein [Nitrolancea hollandica]CCF84452.1 conserved membrane hypothetical protein [Nitrolancea hollandica Lb]